MNIHRAVSRPEAYNQVCFQYHCEPLGIFEKAVMAAGGMMLLRSVAVRSGPAAALMHQDWCLTHALMLTICAVCGSHGASDQLCGWMALLHHGPAIPPPPLKERP